MELERVVKILKIRFINSYRVNLLWKLLFLLCYFIGRLFEDYMVLFYSMYDLCLLGREIFFFDIYEEIIVLLNIFLFCVFFMR